MIAVLDASAAVGVALQIPGAAAIGRQLESVELVLAPDLFVAEVSNALWKYARGGFLATEQCEKILGRVLGLVDQLEASETLSREAFALALRHTHPVCDALYLVLARRNNALLLTLDRRLARLAEQLEITVLSGS